MVCCVILLANKQKLGQIIGCFIFSEPTSFIVMSVVPVLVFLLVLYYHNIVCVVISQVTKCYSVVTNRYLTINPMLFKTLLSFSVLTINKLVTCHKLNAFNVINEVVKHFEDAFQWFNHMSAEVSCTQFAVL